MLCTLLFLTGLQAIDFQAPPLPAAVLTSEGAYLIGEATLAIGQSVDDFSVSPDGQFIVAQRKEKAMLPLSLDRPLLPVVGRNLVIWHRATGATKMVPVTDNVSDFVMVSWLRGTSSAIVTQTSTTVVPPSAPGEASYERYGMTSSLLDARTGTLTQLRTTNDMYATRWSYDASPIAPYAVEVSFSLEPGRRRTPSGARIYRTKIVIRTIGARGAIGKSVPLGDEFVNTGSTAWTAGGREFVLETVKIDETGNDKVVLVHFDPLTGTVTESTTPLEPSKDRDAPKLKLTWTRREEQNDGSTLIARSLWLESLEPSKMRAALVSSDAQSAELSDDCSLIAFRTIGALFVRQCTRIPLEQYWKAWENAERVKIVNRAKQVGLAAIMFASANKQEIPPNLDPMRDLLDYLKDPALLSGLVWVFKGGNLSDIANPTETVMGYIEGQGGRAVIYMDTHVKWVPND